MKVNDIGSQHAAYLSHSDSKCEIIFEILCFTAKYEVRKNRDCRARYPRREFVLRRIASYCMSEAVGTYFSPCSTLLILGC